MKIPTIYLNGNLISTHSDEASVNLADRGLLLGDGLFDTMRAYQGKVFCIEDHWQRMLDGLALLHIPVPLNFEQLQDAIEALLQANDLMHADASLRLTITRGTGPRGLALPDPAHPTYFLTAMAMPVVAEAITAITSSMVRNEYSLITKIKSLNYLENIMARLEAKERGADEALLFNTKGMLVSASAANVFVVQGKNIYTPRLHDGALPGIARKTILKICAEQNISVQEVSIDSQMLTEATEIFMTNSLIEVQVIKQLNHIKFECEPVMSQKIKGWYQRLYRAV